MKSIYESIIGRKGNSYRYYPKTKEELQYIINDKIKRFGQKCDLNDIYTGDIDDMSLLFCYRSPGNINLLHQFNGNISKWDVSRVEDMHAMFAGSQFSGDISEWDVSSVKYMYNMFYGSQFSGDISKWNVKNVIDMRSMFRNAVDFDSDISQWNVENVRYMDYMFDGAVSFNQDISGWNIRNIRSKTYMFIGKCPLKNQPEKQPKFN